MAKDERDEVLREPCPCGKGEVVIDRYTPNHAFGRAWWKSHLACDECDKIYVNYRPYDDKITLVNRADIDAASALDSQVYSAREAFQSDVLEPLRSALLARAEAAGRTYEQWFAALRDILGLDGTAADLRRKAQACGGLRDWIRRHVSEGNAARIADELSIELPISERLATIEQRQAARAALEIRTRHYG